jgi:hypothetical protein
MLDLRPVSRVLDEHHQRFVDEALPEELSRAAFNAFERTRYDNVVLSRGRAAWQNRVLLQQTNLVVAVRFLGDLVEMGTAADIQGLAVRLVRDRGIHLDLARRMAVALGGKDAIPGSVAPPVKIDAEATRRVIDTVVSTLCVGENIGMKVLVEMGKQTECALAKEAIQRVAADAAIHARLGWEMLSVVISALTKEERAFLAGRMPKAFQAAYGLYVPTLVASSTRPGPPLHPFGSLDAVVRLGIYQAAASSVAERFEKHGLPGRASLAEGHRLRDEIDRKRS